MNRKTWLIVLPVFIIILVGVMVITKKAQGAKEYQALPGNGFTYQGQLMQSGNPANGTCDFRFSLWDSLSNGTRTGDVQTVSDIEVKQGYFTIPSLDFGNNAFNGEARWLEIEVKCAGETDYTALDPRQAVSPAPYALAMPGLFTQQNDTSPNVIGGYHGNEVADGVYGASIGGGGAEGSLNQVSDHYGNVAGGFNNQAGNDDAIFDNSQFASVGGGENNNASGAYSGVSGGQSNIASSEHSAVGGGHSNRAEGVGAFVGGGGDDGSRNDGNQAAGSASTIAGGIGNDITITGTYGTIGGGSDNAVFGESGTVCGGQNNHAQGQASTICGGEGNTANADYSTIEGGMGAITTLMGQSAYANGYFSESGDAQSSTYIIRNLSTNASATELFLDGISKRLTLPINRTLTFEIYIVGRRDAYSQSAGYHFRGVIKNDNGETKFSSSYDKFILGEDNPAWDANITASDTYDALIIEVSGAENANIRWVATVRTVEVAW